MVNGWLFFLLQTADNCEFVQFLASFFGSLIREALSIENSKSIAFILSLNCNEEPSEIGLGMNVFTFLIPRFSIEIVCWWMPNGMAVRITFNELQQ